MIFLHRSILTVLFTGSVEVLVGREGLRFVTGPFSYYGTQSLSKILCYT